ncbi:coiled-coil domain-containing protein 175 [Acomys russatus]|uniref:coiled-coil domain-containing protein 175 n=1 Tax=Acomys russatus TaxID=60746 RepID=UPI0021E2F38B|nr:coiled-coil domain-containing protein 175 [Acomys russatus]
MSLRSRTPDKVFAKEKMARPASVSTSLSLELCTFPATLGSSVAATALEQLLVVEKSLQGDYFTCNEEVKTFLKDITIAVKKLEEMRKNTIELLEIESMELSRLYFLLETVPSAINRELEESIRDARRLNLYEINTMRNKIGQMDNEVEFLKTRISELKKTNKALGVKQAELAKEHAKLVLSLNQTLEEKSVATIYINDIYTRINFEREEIALQKQCIQEATQLIEKHKTEYFEKKDFLASQVKEVKQHCGVKRMETYTKRKELNRLQNKILKMKQTVTSSAMKISDHNIEMSRLQESIAIWEKKVEDVKRVCESLEGKLQHFQSHKERLDASSSSKKDVFLDKIQQMGEMAHKIQAENKDLRDRLNTILKQYKVVLKEEENVLSQKKKVYDDNQKQVSLINQKESFLEQRKLNIKNMEGGFGTLQDLHEATKEVYRKQIKIMNENLEREIQRSVVTQWKIACAIKRHARWLLKIKLTMQKIITEIELAEERRVELLDETKQREKEINAFVKQIEKFKMELREEEKSFVKKEKKLIEEVYKYEDLLMKEEQIYKEKEEELVGSLPHLQVAEDDFIEKNRNLKSLHNDVSAKKQEEKLLNSYIFRFKRDIAKYTGNMDNLKQELKQLRECESKKTQENFEILKNLENKIYVNDQKTTLLILENKKIKEYIAYLKKEIQTYRQMAQRNVQDSSDLSWQLIAQHRQYSDLLVLFQIIIKELVSTGQDTLQEIKTLIEKLIHRDERIEFIGGWLLGSIERLQLLIEEELPLDLHNQHLDKPGKKRRNGKTVHFALTTHDGITLTCKKLKETAQKLPQLRRRCECTQAHLLAALMEVSRAAMEERG